MSTNKNGRNGNKKGHVNGSQTIKHSGINHKSNSNDRITSGKPTGKPPKAK